MHKSALRALLAISGLAFGLLGKPALAEPKAHDEPARVDWLPPNPVLFQKGGNEACKEMTRLVTNEVYQRIPLMSLAEYRRLYTRWPAPLRRAYVASSAQKQQEMIRERYGLFPNPFPNPGDTVQLPMGLTLRNDKSGTPMVHANCLLCHGGSRFGEAHPAVGNHRLDLQGIVADVFGQRRNFIVPNLRAHNYTRGAIDATSTAGLYLATRGDDLELLPSGHALGTLGGFPPSPKQFWTDPGLSPKALASGLWKSLPSASSLSKTLGKGISGGPTAAAIDVAQKAKALEVSYHSGVTPSFLRIPSWSEQTQLSKTLYIDGHATRDPGTLRLFALDPATPKADLDGPILKSLTRLNGLIDQCKAPPKYSQVHPARFDAAKAKAGKASFDQCCQRCHGGKDDAGKYDYPGKVVSIETIGTDRTRLDALPPVYRDRVDRLLGTSPKHSWTDSKGYRAPSLVGVAGRPPYLHNGSVPTLRGMLFPDERPTVWRPNQGGLEYDHTAMGLSIQTLPLSYRTPADRAEAREIYDMRRPGFGNSGHDFACIRAMDANQKGDVLEYLKDF